MKLAFIHSLIKAAEEDPKIVLLTGDLGYDIFNGFIERFGPRYVNVGVAEAQLACAAAGLALTGWRPFIYSIASFATARCYEQIKLSVGYHGLPVTIVGAGGGYAYGHSGPTHHAGDDLALMRSVPGMTVLAPGDVNEVRALMPQLLKLQGPVYLRIGRGREPEYHRDDPVVLGRARVLAEGRERVALVTTGETAWEVHGALGKLNEQGLYPAAYQFHTVKPLDRKTLDELPESVKHVVVVEEHARIGGLFSAVAEWSVTSATPRQVSPLCVADEFVLGSPHQREIRQRYGIDASSIAESVQQLIRNEGVGP